MSALDRARRLLDEPAPDVIPGQLAVPEPVRVISFGGGQQSTALLVLAAQGRIDYRTFVFANVGKDSEKPATLQYIEEYAKPYADKHGLELVELRRIMRSGPDKGQERTLLQDVRRPGNRSIRIPMRMANGAPGNRGCTQQWKADLVARETRRRGATPERPAIVGIGISVDEQHRANDRVDFAHQRKVYPLLDLHLRRTDCQRIIRDAKLPLPPKSACWFCPMQRPEDWQNLRREQPELFAKACQLEAEVIERRRSLVDRDGRPKDPIYLTRFARPLAEAIPDGVDLLPMFDEADGACDSGWCMT